MTEEVKIDKDGPPSAGKDFEFTDEELVFFGGEVKDLGEGRIGGYLLQYSTVNDPDLTKDFFSKDESEIEVQPSNLPVYYIHGRDTKMGKRIIGRATTKTDDVGIWAETQLNLCDEYEKAILAMAKAGKLGYSSGALPHLVEREPRGKGVMLVKSWVIGEASLTPTPAEPRNTVVALKSLSTSEMAALPNEDDSKTNPIKEQKKMENEVDVKAVAAAAVADALSARDAADKAKAESAVALKTAEDAGYTKAIEEMKAKRMLKTAPAVIKEIGDDNDGMQAFKSWIKTGQENGGLIQPDASWEKAAYNIGSGAQGGFLVPDPLYATIIAKRQLLSWVRQAPVQAFTTPADHLLVPVENTVAAKFTLTQEAAQYTEDEPTVNQIDIIMYKYTKLVRMSEEFVNYNTTNFDAWLTDAIGRCVGITENTIFTTGTGTGAPQGILTGAQFGGGTLSTVAGSSLTAVSATDLAYLVGLLPAGYNVPSQCVFLMRNATKWLAKSAGATIFAFIPTPSGGDFFGYPALICDDVPLIGTGSAVGAMMFFNANYYGVVEKPGILIQRNPYLYMANGQIGLFVNMFRGGAVLIPESVVLNLNHA